MQSKLILHIGHGKTGTSYIQSVLSLNIDNLKNNGIYYPDHASFNSARLGLISSGNGSLIQDKNYKLDEGLNNLFSDEYLFHFLAEEDNLEQFVINKNWPLEIICYTRNIFEMLISNWGQMVKRGGCTATVNEYLKGDDPHHQKLLWWLNASEKYGFKITVRNYSNYKKNLIERFLQDVLGEGDLNFIPVRPINNIVNRSLTLTEYEIQRVCNIYASHSSQFISDVLVNALPSVTAENPKINREVYENVLERMAPVILQINERISCNEAIVLEGPDAVVGDEVDITQYSLSKEQISVLFNSIGVLINRLQV